MEDTKDKNGFRLEVGTPVRLVATSLDYQMPGRVYHVAEVDGELVLTIPLKEFKTSDEHHAVESVR